MNRTWIAGVALVAMLMGATGAFAAADGKALFTSKCAMCHGAGKPHALKGVAALKLTDAKLMEISFVKPPKGMPTVKLTPDEQKAVVNYVKTL